MWKESFENLYNMHDNSGLLNDFSAYHTESTHVFNYDEISTAIMQLKCKKASGPDGISAEAIKYGGLLLSVHLTVLFNMFTSHCYVPHDLIKTTVIPLLKNKSGDISDINNYRAIALSNCINKLMETVILHSFQSFDSDSDDLQFGFKNSHFTNLGCSVLKHVGDF